jgi:D-arabinose 1-dehydrogenase-like Zn-dependent alcohol dehydrogenase
VSPNVDAIPETMRAAVYRKTHGEITVERIPLPQIGELDLLVKVTACGVCRSDWHIWSGDWD